MLRAINVTISKVVGWLANRARISRYDHLSRAGLNPFFSLITSDDLTLDKARNNLIQGHLKVPNVSGFYHGILCDWFEKHGLGNKCLLVSETKAVADVFSLVYPRTEFISTDFYVDLQPDPKCHFVWDLCSTHPPVGLRGFESIICQATLEHVIDPVQVLRNLSSILTVGGLLYIQTHTPAYLYHPYPRDYIRYQPDWFEDVVNTVKSLRLVNLLCVDGHAFAIYQRLPQQT